MQSRFTLCSLSILHLSLFLIGKREKEINGRIRDQLPTKHQVVGGRFLERMGSFMTMGVGSWKDSPRMKEWIGLESKKCGANPER